MPQQVTDLDGHRHLAGDGEPPEGPVEGVVPLAPVVAWDLQPVAELVARPPGRADLGTLVLLEGRDGAAEEEFEAGDPLDGGERA